MYVTAAEAAETSMNNILSCIYECSSVFSRHFRTNSQQESISIDAYEQCKKRATLLQVLCSNLLGCLFCDQLREWTKKIRNESISLERQKRIEKHLSLVCVGFVCAHVDPF